jgi:hypothetical protein
LVLHFIDYHNDARTNIHQICYLKIFFWTSAAKILRAQYVYTGLINSWGHNENKTNKCIWKYKNLLHYNCCKPPTCFGNFSWSSSGRCYFCEGYIRKTTKPMYKCKKKKLSFKYQTHNILKYTIQIKLFVLNLRG